jgi:acyl-CoA thioester hydrolase
MPRTRIAIPDDAAVMHTAILPVRWGDMDAFRHVNNTKFFRYFEQTRVEWLRTLPGASMEGEVGPVVAHTACAFKQPLRHPATVRVALLSTVPGRSSIETYYRITTEAAPDTVVARGSASIVWIDFATGRPVALPDAMREALPA